MRRHSKSVLRATCVILLSLLTSSSHAQSRSSELSNFSLDVINKSDVVIAAKTMRDDGKAFTFEIIEVLKGTVAGKTIEIPHPIDHAYGDTGMWSKAGDESVFFLKKAADGSFALLVPREGLLMPPGTRESHMEAMKRLIEIASLKDRDAQDRAMLAEAGSANPSLSRAAGMYLQRTLARRPNRLDYKNDLIALLKNPRAEAASLYALSEMNASEVIPVAVEATKGKDPDRAKAGAAFLSHYKTPESLAALIALSASPDSDMRSEAAARLGESEWREGVAPIMKLLEDKDAGVRVAAASGLRRPLRLGLADEAIPKLAGLLDDPSSDVQRMAGLALGDSRKAQAVKPLLDVLRRGPNYGASLGATSGLETLYRYGEPEARAEIDASIELLVSLLNRDPRLPPLPAVAQVLSMSRAPAATEALEQAAKNHPNAFVRGQAEYVLKNRQTRPAFESDAQALFDAEARARDAAIRAAHEEAEGGWGEAVDGVQVRLRPATSEWMWGDAISLTADIRNLGPLNLTFVGPIQSGAKLEVDGAQYVFVGEVLNRLTRNLGPAHTHTGLSLAIQRNPDDTWRAPAADTPLRLAPGKHSIRVGVEILSEDKTALATLVWSKMIEVTMKEGLPGSRLTVSDAVKDRFAFAAVCEAMSDSPVTIRDYAEKSGGVQRVKIAELLGGEKPRGDMVEITYQHEFGWWANERRIAKGERVIWIVSFLPGPNPDLVGVKALPDTPENRAAVIKAAGALRK